MEIYILQAIFSIARSIEEVNFFYFTLKYEGERKTYVMRNY